MTMAIMEETSSFDGWRWCLVLFGYCVCFSVRLGLLITVVVVICRMSLMMRMKQKESDMASCLLRALTT